MALPVSVPASEEAAALGGAIQALWTLERTRDKAASIETLTDEHVAAATKAVLPDASEAAAYEAAYRDYMKYLDALRGLYQ
jgi:xylulokinase